MQVYDAYTNIIPVSVINGCRVFEGCSSSLTSYQRIHPCVVDFEAWRYAERNRDFRFAFMAANLGSQGTRHTGEELPFYQGRVFLEV